MMGQGTGRSRTGWPGPSGWTPPRWGRISSRGRSRPAWRPRASRTWPDTSGSSTARGRSCKPSSKRWSSRRAGSSAIPARSRSSASMPAPAERATLRCPPLRVLSLPCAGGRNPTPSPWRCIDAGLPPAAIPDRRRGHQRPGARAGPSRRVQPERVPGADSSFRTRYFHQGPEGFALDAAVKGTVRFIRGNLLDPGLLADRPPYDVVFCRNLLIYLDRDARERAVAALDRLLAPSGLVFIGHAETLSFPSSRFVMADESGSFAYRRASPDAKAASPRRRESSRPKPRPSRPPARSLPATVPPALPGPAPVRALPDADRVSATLFDALERASDLANQRQYRGGHPALPAVDSRGRADGPGVFPAGDHPPGGRGRASGRGLFPQGGLPRWPARRGAARPGPDRQASRRSSLRGRISSPGDPRLAE